jgi:signal transduction histidine kinase
MSIEVAGVVGRLLEGAGIRSIPVRQAALVPMVNWKALNRWGLKANRLPPRTVIRYREPSLWDAYGWHILGIITLCLIEGGLIVALLVHRRHRRRAEIAALASRRLLQSTIDALNSRVALLDHRGTIIAANRSWKTYAEANRHEDSVAGIGFNYLGASAAQPQGQDAQMVSGAIQQLMSGELEDFRCVYPSTQMNRTLWFQVRVSRFEMYGAVRMVVVYEDVTQIKEAHDSQEKLTGLLMSAQDDERRRIARELHDSTVQDMVAIKAGLACVGKGAKYLDSDLNATLQESVSLCNQVIEELRTLSYLLHPPFLDEAGLVAALKWFVRGFSQRSGIPVELMVVDDIGRLPTGVETALFRVVQESLTNIHRHSGGGRTKEKDTVALRIMDDGHGFSLPAPEDSLEGSLLPGVGISGMRQRLRQFGGQLEIESGPQGTTVNASVFLSEDRSHAHLTR